MRFLCPWNFPGKNTPGDLPNPGIKPASPALTGRFFYHCTTWDAPANGKRDTNLNLSWTFSSVQFSHSVVSNSSRPHEPQHTRPPCPSPTPRAYPNSCPLSRWCHPNISSSVVPFSSCSQSFPASESFQMSQLFASCGQSNGVSTSTSVLSMNQDWSPLGWTGWMELNISVLYILLFYR